MNKTRDEIKLKEFGENFRNLRRSMKLTQKALSLEAEIEVSQISRIETGKVNATVTTILQLSEAMNIHPSKFFDYKSAKARK